MSSKKSSDSKLFQLISALNGQLDLIGEDYADILWLALKQKEYQTTPVEPEPEKIETSQLKIFQFSYLWLNFVANGLHNFVFLLFPPISKKKPDPIPPPRPSEPKVPIIPQSATQQGLGGTKQETLPLRHPDPPSIQSPLECAKALRPLIRKVPSGRKTLLDEAQTVQKTAEQQICIPVFQNEPEPWLDLALVIDNSPSMVIWSSTIKELKKILLGYGIFREARIWDLIVDDKRAVSLSSKYGKKEQIHNPQQLVDPTRRRLILIVSDCVNPIWFDGSLLTTLQAWTKHQPLAIVQMLPNLMWQMTGLRIGAFVELSNLIPGAANRNLCIQELLIWKKLDLERGTKVPVLTLNPEATSLWSDFTVGKYGAISPGFVFPVKSEFDRIPKPPKSAQAQIVELSAEDRVKRFRSISSPTGRNLAGFLVSAPIITLPVVRLIQKLFLPDSETVHVAEVFLGGILKPTIHVTRETNPDGIVFDVADDDIRNILLKDFPLSDSVLVFKKISQFIEANLGKTLAECVGLLANPNQSGKEDALAKAYGEISLKVLDGLGGKNKEFADRIRQTGKIIDDPIPPSSNLIRLTRRVALRYPDWSVISSEKVFAEYDSILNTVKKALNQNSWVEVVDEDEQFDFQLSINEQGQFEIADVEGEAFSNIRPVLAAEAKNTARTTRRLVRLAQFDIIEQLDNPESRLAESIKFELLDRDKNPYPDSEIIALPKTNAIYFRITNNSPNRVYCTILDLDPNWGISTISLSASDVNITYLIESGEEINSEKLLFTSREDKLYDLATETFKLFVYNLELNSLGKLLTDISADIDAPETNNRGVSYDLKSQSDVDWATKKIKISRFYPEPSINLESLTVTTAKLYFEEDSILEFKTITVDSSGQTIKEETHQNTYFEQELGEYVPPLIMMAIPEGEFMMGSPEDEPQRNDRESPQHQVKVSPFWLAETPVTNAQWNFVVNNLPQEQIELTSKKTEEKGDHPVTEVNLYQAMEFCARLSRFTGRSYRLPSEAEWEYACRANTTTPFHFGETITGKLANYNASVTYAQESAGEYRRDTLPVKSFSPNAFGLYDMHGNVWEWCADPWHEDYQDAPQNRDSSVWDEEYNNDNHYHNILENLKELLNDERSRILRGGSFDDDPRYCRSAFRFRGDPDDVDVNDIGFRLAVSDPRTL